MLNDGDLTGRHTTNARSGERHDKAVINDLLRAMAIQQRAGTGAPPPVIGECVRFNYVVVQRDNEYGDVYR
jgi:hypothetical protein